MTVLEVIQKSAEFLTRKGVESPRLQTELLLAHVLKLPRMKLYLNFERQLTPAEADTLRGMVKRRGQREPLQHIVGSTSFCGLEITVNRHVLVPRPETELLAEAGWQFLSNRDLQSATCLDFGTGSGCIAIALAAKCPAARIVATDVSREAIALAAQNAARNGVGGKVQFLCGHGFAALTCTDQSGWGERPREPQGLADHGSPGVSPHAGDARKCSPQREGLEFDLIISNPPYIPSAEIASLQPEVRDFDPRGALDGGADGLDFYRLLAAQAGSYLNRGGKLMLEFGDGQASALRKIFEAEMWIVEAVREDYTQRQRILIAHAN